MQDRKHRSRISRVVAALVMALLLVGSIANVASAVEYTAARKVGRGLAGMTTGFLEIPGNMVVETRRNGYGYGMTLGFVKGLGFVVVRELVGVYEFVTSPFPVPAGYRPVIQPEFPWDYFDDQRELADRR
jgi:putative exosortase-associated protein (TIGR04073 family)